MMYHVWLQMLFDGRRFVVNRSATFLYRQHAASMSHNLGEREAALPGAAARGVARAGDRAIRPRAGSVPPVRLRLARYALARRSAADSSGSPASSHGPVAGRPPVTLPVSGMSCSTKVTPGGLVPREL